MFWYTPSVESPWTLDIVRLEYWKEKGDIMSTDLIGKVKDYWTGQCPLSPWAMSNESMDNVKLVHGQMSTESMDGVYSVFFLNI